MHRSLTMLTITAVVALTACGSSGDSLTAATDATVAESPAVVPATEPATTTDTTPAVDPAPATTAEIAPETTAAPATPTTEPEPVGGGDPECLNGEWLADATAIGNQMSAIGSPMTFVIGPDSYNRATLDNGAFVVDAVVTIGAEFPGGGVTLSATSTSRLEGTYTTDGNVVLADVTVDSGEITSWNATVDGESIELPAAAVDSFGDPPEVATSFNGSTFDCSDTSLTFDVIDSEFGTITYTRVS